MWQLIGSRIWSLVVLAALGSIAPLLQAAVPGIPDWIYGPFALLIGLAVALWAGVKEKPLWYSGTAYRAMEDRAIKSEKRVDDLTERLISVVSVAEHTVETTGQAVKLVAPGNGRRPPARKEAANVDHA